MESSVNLLHGDETIVAIATPPGRGALGVLRISGPLTLDILADFCREIHRSHSHEIHEKKKTITFATRARLA